MHEEYQSKTIEVYGDKEARKKNHIPAYQRQLATRSVTFTCGICKAIVTQERYPGPTPKYCSDGCIQAAADLRQEERVRKQREKRQAAATLKKAQSVTATSK
jgi:hypothetical protein